MSTFAVTEEVEAVYGEPKRLPVDAGGAEMRKLRAEMHRRGRHGSVASSDPDLEHQAAQEPPLMPARVRSCRAGRPRRPRTGDPLRSGGGCAAQFGGRCRG